MPEQKKRRQQQQQHRKRKQRNVRNYSTLLFGSQNEIKKERKLCKCQLKYEKPQIITTKTSRNIASNIICCFARFVLIVSHRSVTPRALPNCDAAAAAPKTVAQLGAARKKVPISDNLFVI